MVWLAFAAGWVLGSATLYFYMVATAREPDDDRCMDCHLLTCSECPYDAEAANIVTGRAA